MSLAGKAVLVTGTTSGLGRSIARVWAAQGARVIATGRRAELGESLEKEVRDAGGELSFLRLDVSSRDDCQQAVQAVLDSYGRVDILVNNAGIEGPIVDAHEMSEDDWDEVVGVNLNGAFYCSKHAIRAMKAQGGGGALLHIASINAIEALGHMVAYNTTKAGLVQLSRSLAVEYLFDGIRSNAIVLGGVRGGETGIRTQDGLAKLLRGEDYVRPQEDDPLAEHVLQDPDEVAGMLALFCSDQARLLTGATIAVDRAMTAGFTSSAMVHMSTAGLMGGAG
jgi:NAD(P)-dependent dehydrogenase (short-subunit alcohol dehydrogenase family)